MLLKVESLLSNIEIVFSFVGCGEIWEVGNLLVKFDRQDAVYGKVLPDPDEDEQRELW